MATFVVNSTTVHLSLCGFIHMFSSRFYHCFGGLTIYFFLLHNQYALQIGCNETLYWKQSWNFGEMDQRRNGEESRSWNSTIVIVAKNTRKLNIFRGHLPIKGFVMRNTCLSRSPRSKIKMKTA